MVSLTVGCRHASHGALHDSTAESLLSSDALALFLHRAQQAHSYTRDMVQQQYTNRQSDICRTKKLVLSLTIRQTLRQWPPVSSAVRSGGPPKGHQ